MNKFKNIVIKYDNMIIAECLELYDKNVCCICNGDDKQLSFVEEK